MSTDTPQPPRTVQELFDLSGQVAIVTGAGTGLGFQMATALAEAGATLVLCARNEERCVRAAAEMSENGVEALGLACNVSDEEQVDAMVGQVMAKYGRIDILVNNAGTSWGSAPEDHPTAGWNKVLNVNLTGTFLCSRAVGRHMLEARAGRIINIASVAGLRGAEPDARQAIAYSSSKGGVLAFTRDLACQWAERGIRVNAIAPGWFPTAISEQTLETGGDKLLERIPMRRLGSSDDLKGAVVYLASPASAYMTGQTLVIDGGKTIS